MEEIRSLPSAPKILHAFGPNPQANDSDQEAVLTTGKPWVHHTPRGRESPSLHQRGRHSPSLHHRKQVFSEPHHPISTPQTNLHTSLLRNILTNQEMMMDQMKIIFTTVQGLKSATEEAIGVEPNLLPLAHPQSVENLEERLRNSPDLKNQLKNALALKGGGNIKECVKRVMAATLTHALAKNMNMKGINGKISFQHLQVKEVVIGGYQVDIWCQYRNCSGPVQVHQCVHSWPMCGPPLANQIWATKGPSFFAVFGPSVPVSCASFLSSTLDSLPWLSVGLQTEFSEGSSSLLVDLLTRFSVGLLCVSVDVQTYFAAGPQHC
ncbi:hypothetical protein CHARACLAT_013648 [Characodon lateralis]|uniref:DUF4806 domain-containing protein n=1 Tax=Characodon lateralis TaxID=208331 RepID=A0ABU7EIU3_9TELE|nr:hypothetical protein [Characodon lateralis]